MQFSTNHIFLQYHSFHFCKNTSNDNCFSQKFREFFTRWNAFPFPLAENVAMCFETILSTYIHNARCTTEVCDLQKSTLRCSKNAQSKILLAGFCSHGEGQVRNFSPELYLIRLRCKISCLRQLFSTRGQGIVWYVGRSLAIKRRNFLMVSRHNPVSRVC